MNFIRKLYQEVKPHSIRDLYNPEYLFANIFWLITISALCTLLLNIPWLMTLLLPIILYYLAFKRRNLYTRSIIDVLWFICFLWMIFTIVANEHPHSAIMVFRCFVSQIAYMFAYWIGKKSDGFDFDRIMKYAFIPLSITSLIGIYCYIFEPRWYMDVLSVAEENRDINSGNYLEFYRLRSIFSSPYTLSYLNCLCFTYLSFVVFCGKGNKWYYMMMLLSFCTMLLCMQRAPIVCALLGIGTAVFFGYINGKVKNNIITVVILILLSIGVIPMVLRQLSPEQYAYLESKLNSVTSDDSDLLESRLYLMDAEETFIGDGAGRHNIYADKYPPNYSMRDGEYMKILQEQGYVGLVLTILIFVVGILKSFRYFKYLGLECVIMVMLLIFMIGANPLSTSDKYPYIYWLLLGVIAKFSYNDKTAYINRYSKL